MGSSASGASKPLRTSSRKNAREKGGRSGITSRRTSLRPDEFHVIRVSLVRYVDASSFSVSRSAAEPVPRSSHAPSPFVVTAENPPNVMVAPATGAPVTLSTTNPARLQVFAGGDDGGRLGAVGDDLLPQATSGTKRRNASVLFMG